MATGTYAPDPDLHIVDANGVPVPGGLIWTYIAGTLTPTPTYTDVGLLVPNTNPIVAGSDGRFVAFLAGGISYKFVYEMPAVPPAHGATLATRDNILAVTTIVPGTGGGIVQLTSLIGTVNDFALIPGCSVVACLNASPLTITGLAGGVDGQRVTIIGKNSSITLPHLSSSSLGINRLLNTASSAPTVIAAASQSYGWATYTYDGAFTRWTMIGHEQGGWITPPFGASDFSSGGGGTWTVAAGNVAVMKYRLSGRTISVCFQLNNTTIGGAPGQLFLGANQFGGHTLVGGPTSPLAFSSDFAVPIMINGSVANLVIQKFNSTAFVATSTFSCFGTWLGDVA